MPSSKPSEALRRDVVLSCSSARYSRAYIRAGYACQVQSAYTRYTNGVQNWISLVFVYTRPARCNIPILGSQRRKKRNFVATCAVVAERWVVVRLRPERSNHVWSYDFVSAMTHDGRTLRMLTLIDEYTRECLAIRVARKLGKYEVIEELADVMLLRGIPDYMRSDNGPEFVAKEVRSWLAKLGTGTLYIEPGSPWENGYCERFNGKMRDECLNGEIFYSLKEAQMVIEKWRVVYNTLRPHSALRCRPPAPAACSPMVPNPISQPLAVM
jgi:putative transposase